MLGFAVLFLLDDSPGFWILCADVLEHLVPSSSINMEHTECSEKSVYKIRTSGNHPGERIQHSEQGKSLKLSNAGLFKRARVHVIIFLFPQAFCARWFWTTHRGRPLPTNLAL